MPMTAVCCQSQNVAFFEGQNIQNTFYRDFSFDFEEGKLQINKSKLVCTRFVRLLCLESIIFFSND